MKHWISLEWRELLVTFIHVPTLAVTRRPYILRKHMIACHTFDGILGNVVTDPEERENSMEPFVCKCKYSAEDLSSLLQHVQNNHPYMLTKSPSMKRPRTLENSEGTEEPEILTKRPRKHGDGVPITFVGGWFRCEFCSYQNLLRDHVQRHIKRRKNDDVYRCSSCSYKSCSEHSLKVHISKNHYKKKYGVFFKSNSFLRLQHPITEQGSSSWSTIEMVDPETVGNQEIVVENVEDPIPSTPISHPPSYPESSISQTKRTCRRCKVIFQSSLELGIHFQERSKKTHKCSVCCFSCDYQSNMIRHMKSHH